MSLAFIGACRRKLAQIASVSVATAWSGMIGNSRISEASNTASDNREMLGGQSRKIKIIIIGERFNNFRNRCGRFFLGIQHQIEISEGEVGREQV